jgi:hypothetical protein
MVRTAKITTTISHLSELDRAPITPLGVKPTAGHSELVFQIHRDNITDV